MRSLRTVTIALASMTGFGMAGCSSTSETGDVEAAVKGAAKAPKTVEQLPSDMPPEAKRAASAAIGQAQAAEAQANDPARVRALKEMNRQRGR